MQTELYPILWSYEACAVRQVRSVAATEPGLPFEHLEISIQPACGAHIDRVRARLLGMGYDVGSAQEEIRVYYDTLRPKLMVAYEEARRVSVRPAPEPLDGEEEFRERVRRALMKDLDQTHRDCIRRAIATIVPYSTERAEILVEAVTGRCMDFEQKRVELLQVLFDAPREQAVRVVERVLETERRRVLADVVTVRAMVNKRAAERAVGIDPETTGGIGTRAVILTKPPR
jgi:hypothetical protein